MTDTVKLFINPPVYRQGLSNEIPVRDIDINSFRLLSPEAAVILTNASIQNHSSGRAPHGRPQGN